MSFRLKKTETCNFRLCNFGPAIAKDMQLTKCSVQVFSQLYNLPMLSIDHIRASPYDEQVSKYHFESTTPTINAWRHQTVPSIRCSIVARQFFYCYTLR